MKQTLYALTTALTLGCGSPDQIEIGKVTIVLNYDAHPDYHKNSPRREESIAQLEQAVREEVTEMILAQDFKGILAEHSKVIKERAEIRRHGLNVSDPYDMSLELEKVKYGKWDLELYDKFSKKYPGCSMSLGGDIIYHPQKDDPFKALRFGQCLEGDTAKCPDQIVSIYRIDVNAHCGTLPGQKPNIDPKDYVSSEAKAVQADNTQATKTIDPIERVIVSLCTDPIKEVQSWWE